MHHIFQMLFENINRPVVTFLPFIRNPSHLQVSDAEFGPLGFEPGAPPCPSSMNPHNIELWRVGGLSQQSGAHKRAHQSFIVDHEILETAPALKAGKKMSKHIAWNDLLF